MNTNIQCRDWIIFYYTYGWHDGVLKGFLLKLYKVFQQCALEHMQVIIFLRKKNGDSQKQLQKNTFGIENKTGVAFNDLKRGDSAHCKVSYSLSQVFTALLAMCSAHS